MRSIDIHAHLIPQSYVKATREGKGWHGLTPGQLPITPRASWNPEQRIQDMDSLGVDVHVVSTGSPFYFYDRDLDVTKASSRECNDEVYQMTMDYPTRFAGLGTLPMQDIPSAINELERCMTSPSSSPSGRLLKRWALCSSFTSDPARHRSGIAPPITTCQTP